MIEIKIIISYLKIDVPSEVLILGTADYWRSNMANSYPDCGMLAIYTDFYFIIRDMYFISQSCKVFYIRWESPAIDIYVLQSSPGKILSRIYNVGPRLKCQVLRNPCLEKLQP